MKLRFSLGILFFLIFAILNFISANTYYSDVYFTLPDTVYVINERIEFIGYVMQSNYSNNGTVITNSSALTSVNINLTIRNSSGSYISNYTFTTDSSGAFYSRSNYHTNSTEINTSSVAGTYYVRTEYKDPNNSTSFSEVEIIVVNQTLDLLKVTSNKASYNPSESVVVNVEAIRLIGDKTLYVANVSVNGSLRNSTDDSLQTFNCTTASNGKCSVTITAPLTYGEYVLELNNFKTFNNLFVVPFSYAVYMKDDLGESFKNVFAMGEQASVQVRINNASTSDVYTFSGYIADSSGNSVKTITSTTLNNNNSFTNNFVFTVDAVTFSYSTYSAHITVIKSGNGNMSSITSFQVQDWMLSVNKKEAGSGFEYESSVFPNKTIKLEALPNYRANGTLILNITSSSFVINLKDNLNNVLVNSTAVWNATCGKSGCYEFNLTSPLNTGQYVLYTTLSYNGDIQTESKIINVINGVMTAQSTDKDGTIKELFGTNEHVYLSLLAYNLTSSSFNLSDAEVFIVKYMNGSEFSYSQVNYSSVNSSNSVYEWAWNSSSQRIKLDVPKAGGVYNIFIFGNNRTLGAEAKFIINPYDVCSAAKDNPGQAGGSTGYYYVWQFKTTDTVYFEIKINQANNPTGRASASNWSTGNSSGMGAACVLDTTTKQVVTNATLTIVEVKNLESGALQNLNSTDSTCQASDNSGTYICTVKPLTKWEGGQNIVKFNIRAQDGTTSVAFSRFESRAFYLYGWSSNWQNNPTSNITLNIQMYEAGSGWWGGGGSRGLSGSVSVRRVEYQGSDGEWIWPPVDSGYNSSNLNSTSISGSAGTINIPVSNMAGGRWKTGYYRVVLQATTSGGDSDYGYAWFGVKLWDVYGQPIECLSTGCNYKSYFNSKENITLYVKINKAGSNWWSSDSGGQDIYGNVTIGVKKIQDCRKWPCKELNSSQYSASRIVVNTSSAGYWYSGVNSTYANNYLIRINSTLGTWGTGWYSVTLDVNGTDTGSAWFNTIAFYVETQPTNSNGSNYKYNIRGNQPMYFNVTTVKNYKYGYWYNNSWIRYNSSDYINTTFDSAVLRTWDPQTYRSREFSYPTDINITPNNISGNGLLNITYLNGSWPTGYYWGELTLKNSDNETSTGWLWFNVQPFRVQINTVGNTWNMDSDSCVNTTVYIYDPDWYSNTLLYGNYSITGVYEDVWGGYSSSRTIYANYTSQSFNATINIIFCPNNGSWSGGNWGGYHYLNVVVRDNILNDTQTGWLSFRTIPFILRWNNGNNYLGYYATNANINVSVNLTKPLTGASTAGNLTRLYQWRYDNYRSTLEEYRFVVGNCDSSVSGQCTINGTQNITIYAPSGGWKVGYNYLQAEWTKHNDASVKVQEWSNVYFDGRESYNGWFNNYDLNGGYKYYFAANENITIQLNIRDSAYNSVNVNITNVEYAYSGDSCWSEWCRTYTTATYSPAATSSGNAILNIRVPSGGWTRGYYYIRASVSGSAGTATITGGSVRVKDMVAPNITFIFPVNNGTYNNSLLFSATTTESSQCSIYFVNYDNFYSWFCSAIINSTNSSNSSVSAQSLGACNTTIYNYTGSRYYTEYIYKDYHSIYDGSNYSYCSSYYGSSCYGPQSSKTNSYLTTGGTSHSYTLDITNFTNQHYGINVWCYDDDYNYVSALVAFKVNSSIIQNTSDTTPPQVTINSPTNTFYDTSSILFNFTLNENGTCQYTLNNGATNYTMSTLNNRNFNATNSSIADANYTVRAYCNDTSGNKNYTQNIIFSIDTTYPLIDYTGGTTNGTNLTQNWIFVNVSVTETNFANITFSLRNLTSSVNLTTFTSLVTFINWTNLSYTNYTFNVSVYDRAGHFNSTSTRSVNLSG